MAIQVHIKPPPPAERLTITVHLESTTLHAFKSEVAQLVSIPLEEVRLVVGGRILKGDDDTPISAMDLTENCTINVARIKPAAPTPAQTVPSPSSSSRPSMSAFGLPVLRERNTKEETSDGAEDMLNNPMVSAMLENPQFMQMMMQADPRLQAAAERNPEIRQMMNDPSFLRQISSAIRNPAVMQEMMRNNDRTISNIESYPGGMAALSSMYNSMQQEEAALDSRPVTTDESNRRFAERLGANLDRPTEGPNTAALPNPWAPQPQQQAAGTENARGSRDVGGFPGLGGMGANPFMMPGMPGMQGLPGMPRPPLNPAASGQPQAGMPPMDIGLLMSLLGGGAGPATASGNTGVAGAGGGAAPGSAASPGGAADPQRQMQDFFTQMQQLRQLEDSLAAFAPFNAGASLAWGAGAAGTPTAGAAATSPAGAAASSPAAPAVSNEERFKDQLANMHEMGFTDDAKNIKALLAANHIDNCAFAVNEKGAIPVTSPATGEVIAYAPCSSKDDVNHAVASAKKAFHAWSNRTIKDRVQVIIRFHALVVKHSDELADLIVKEHGKTKAEALADVAKGNETVEYAMSLPQTTQGKILEVSRGVTCTDKKVPLGVVASIVPFNFPMMVPMWTLPICIALGNCIVLKPSEKVPLTMNRVMDLLKEAGVPAGVVNLVNGSRETAEYLVDHPDVKAVTFVGSSPVAEALQLRGRALGKRVLALGGAKNHLVAAPDANIEMASQDVVNSFTGCSGQRCMAASVLLTVGKQEALVKRIVEKAAAIVPGQDGAATMGPVIDLAAKERIARYIEEAEKGGAEILLDGRGWMKRDKGWWVGPTVIKHKRREDKALHDEIFGPVLSILEVETKEEAIEIENANPFGNAAAIYTSSGGVAEWFSKRFTAGMIGGTFVPYRYKGLSMLMILRLTVNIGVPVPREPFSFGGINRSNFGDSDITGEGFNTCPYFLNAVRVANMLASNYPETISVVLNGVSRDEWLTRKVNLAKTIPGASRHTTSPFVFEGCASSVSSYNFIGGNDNFVAYVKETYGDVNEE
ncbi:hypothetical protein HK101_007814 [Irineochytrium annulatum]|nr:hypothetical protein HK101_007814 [Irineochytrium annulatum]